MDIKEKAKLLAEEKGHLLSDFYKGVDSYNEFSEKIAEGYLTAHCLRCYEIIYIIRDRIVGSLIKRKCSTPNREITWMEHVLYNINKSKKPISDYKDKKSFPHKKGKVIDLFNKLRKRK
jgi:hypothetical protein